MTNSPSLALRTGSVLRQIDHELRESGIRISQLTIANEVGITPGMISKWFGGTFAPPLHRLPALAKALSNGDTAREQDYFRRLKVVFNPSQIETPKAQSGEELRNYAFQIFGDLGLSQDYRDMLLENPALLTAFSDCTEPQYVDGVRKIRTAGLRTFLDDLTRDPLRLDAFRLGIQALKTSQPS